MEKTKKELTPKQKSPRLKWMRYNRWIVENIPFTFFLGTLALLYIANGHYADKINREISRKEKNLKEMEFEFKTVKRDVIFRSKESELVKAVEPLGLQQLITPPVRIIDTIQKTK